MIAADKRFHDFIYALSGNPLVAPTMATHWSYTKRLMGQALVHDEQPRDIWDQHAQILDAIGSGDADRAESLAREHITLAARFMLSRVRGEANAAVPRPPPAGEHG
jgi:DNA-binding GntR family transcriptional regulator